MRVLKPQRLSLLQRIFEIRGGRYLALGAATYATFEAPNRPLAETELWADLPSQLGAGQVLDEGLPKPRGEVLVFGRGFVVGDPRPSHRVRLQAGPVDKSVEVQTERGYALGLLGPRDASHPERRARLGTYDKVWLENEAPGFPKDLHPDTFMMAPAEQQLDGFWKGDEPIRLENVHPAEAVLTTRVTALSARCFVVRKGKEPRLVEEVPTHLDTIALLPNVNRTISIFRGVTQIVDFDAADIDCVLVALERRADPRAKEHYQTVLEQRLDDKRGVLFSLRDRDLLPPRDPSEGPEPVRAARALPAMPARMRARAARELEAAREKVAALGRDPDACGLPREVPPQVEVPDNEDLVEFMEGIDAEAQRMRADGEAKKDEAIAQARANLAALGVDYDEAVERGKLEGGGPPTFRAEAHLANLRGTAQAARDLGAPIDEIEAQIQDPKLYEKLKKAEDAQLMMYRLAAQHQPPARRPDEAARAATRERVTAALQEGRSMMGWDLTGADLHGLDLSGADLSMALLECADLSGCTGATPNLSGAVLTRASLTGAKLDRANLEGANLGEVRASGASLSGATLGKATLQRADLTHALLPGADLRKADLLGARIAGADLRDANLDELFLYECDLGAVSFRGASLTQATLLRCKLDGASFADANLTSTTFVESRGSGVSFRKARARNLRVVLDCAFEGADFEEADLTSANLRKTLLRGASFKRVIADGVDLTEADLREATFTKARLRGARLVRTELGGADLSSTDLIEAMLQGARVPGTSFERAVLFRANLLDAKGDAKTSFQGAHVVRVLQPKGTS